MRFSWEWLLEHVELQSEPQEAADLLSKHGLTVDEVIEEGGDVVLDIDITPNRPDAMNVRGVARELVAVAGAPLRPLALGYDEAQKPAAELCSVRIDDPQGCRRFCARVIEGVTNGPAPDWMARRLERVGLRSINLLVDITNYVLWELGHPLHGYDLALVPGGEIVVRRAAAGERLRTIDDVERTLDPSILAIADRERAIGIGGVMGGADSEINEATVGILLEGAYFDPVLIRRGSRKLGLSTEASYRFERGADINGMVEAIDRCCHLYQRLAGGSVLAGMVDQYPAPREPVRIEMEGKRLCSFAGLEIPAKRVGEIFEALELPARREGDIWTVDVPSRRVDLEREADLFEEAIRIVGYDKVPATLPHVDLPPAGATPLQSTVDAAEGAMLAAGYSEVLNYDFVDPEQNRIFAPAGAGEPIEVLNPIAAPQMSVMRQSLAPSLLTNIRHNHTRGQTGVRLFEIARTFFYEGGAPVERTTVGFAADALEPAPFWHSTPRPADFFESKGVMEFLFTRLDLRDMIISEGSAEFLEPAARADVSHRGEQVGWFGQVAEGVLARFDLPGAVFGGQIELEGLAGEGAPDRRFRRGSRFPSVSRDISFTLGSEATFAQVRGAIEAAGVEELVEIRLLDLYRGESTSGKPSLTVRVVYQSRDRTLTQEEVESYHGQVRGSLSKLGVEFR